MMGRSRVSWVLLLLFLSNLVILSRSEYIGDPTFEFSHSYSLDLSSGADASLSEKVETSLLSVYDGCSISSEAYITSDEANSDKNSNLMAMWDEETDEDDPDDDDEDDGHSSMLSNASVRRSASYQGHAYMTGYIANDDNQQPRASRTAATVAMLRGGATEAAVVKVGSEVLQNLCTTALTTLIFEACIGHILEFLKITMQTAKEDMTYAKAITDITQTKGLFALWDGFVPWGVVQAISKGAVFGMAHTATLQMLVPLAQRGLIPIALALTLAGGIGGGFQGLVLSPTLLLKTRVMTNPAFRESTSLLRTTWLSLCIGLEVVRTEGLLALLKGSRTFATKRVFDWSTRYYFANVVEELFSFLKGGDQALTIGEKSVASLFGGVASTCATLPLDVLVAKTQDAKQAGVKVSPVQLFRDQLKEEGLSGLKHAYMRGFEARLLHVCLTTLVVKTLSPFVHAKSFGNLT